MIEFDLDGHDYIELHSLLKVTSLCESGGVAKLLIAANINSRDIGQIKILNDHCLVDLPSDMPSATFRLLQKVWICGQQLQISPADERFPTKTEKPKYKGTPRNGDGKYFKPGGKKPPRSRPPRPKSS